MGLEDWNIENDPRSRAARRNRHFTVESETRSTCVVSLGETLLEACHDEEIEVEEQFECSVEREVCSLCDGLGTVVNPEIDASGLTREDFDDDPDFERDYHAGVFDITCPECRGNKVVAVPKLPDAVRRVLTQLIEDDAEYDALCAAERRMGA